MPSWEIDPDQQSTNSQSDQVQPGLREPVPVVADPTQKQPACRLSGFGSFFRETLSVYKNNFWTFLLISAMPFVASFILPKIFLVKLISGPSFESLILIIPVYVAVIIVYLWSTASLLYALKERANKISIGGALGKGFSILGSYFWVSFLVLVIVAGGFILFIIPGIIFSIWFSLSLLVLINEDRKGMSALKRSKELILGYVTAYFGRTLLFGLIIGIISFLLSFVIRFVFAFPQASYISAIVDIIATSIVLIFSVLLYENIKKLKENGCAKSPREIRYVLMIFLLFLPIIGILATIVLVNVNSAKIKAKDVYVTSSMYQMRVYAEFIRDSDPGFSYSGVSCSNSQMVSPCSAIKEKTGQNPIIYSSSNTYCAYTKLPSKSYFCIDSLGNALGAKSFPNCNGVTFSCL